MYLKCGHIQFVTLLEGARSMETSGLAWGTRKQLLQWCCIVGWLAVTSSLVLATCPNSNECDCEVNSEGQQIINCRSKGLTTIPSFVSSVKQYYELTLARNSIPTLSDAAFSVLNIRRLDISDNPVTQIDNGAFTGLGNVLEQLVFHVNSMTTFPTSAISGLTNLKVLHVKGFALGGSLPASALQPFTSLQDLTLHSCGLSSLTTVDTQAFEQTIHTLSLQHNGFTTPPKDILNKMPSLVNLNMAENSFTSIPNNCFQTNTKLTHLDLSQNGIDSMAGLAFQGLEASLSTLNLKHNKLLNHHIVAIQNLQQLNSLDVSDNQLTGLQQNVFGSLTRLITIDAQNNMITGLSAGTMAAVCSSLQTLILTNNRIQNIDVGAFILCSQLRELWLGDQSLSSILTQSVFSGLEKSLQTIHLDQTGFVSSNWPSITSLQALRSLNLAGNHIVSIPDKTFEKLTSLDYLQLSYNQIRGLTQEGMHGLQDTLTALHLQSNQITSLSNCVFHNYLDGKLSTINLYLNPLHCDCQLRWLRQWVSDNYESTNIFLINWNCSSPPVHNGKLFRNIAVSDLNCTDGTPPTQVCKDLTPATTTLSETTSGAVHTTVIPHHTTQDNTIHNIVVNITDTTHQSIRVVWSVGTIPGLVYFNVQYWSQGNDGDMYKKGVDKSLRELTVSNLNSSTEYTACVVPVLTNNRFGKGSCDNTVTSAVPKASTGTKIHLDIILGVVFGALAFLILLVVGILLYCHCFRKHEKSPYDRPSFPARDDMPKMGYGSKRFSKHRPPSSSTAASNAEKTANSQRELKLDTFSLDERDRILKQLAVNNNGCVDRTNLSMVSSGSQRYLPELPKRTTNSQQDGYLNPTETTSDDDDPNSHIYMEINYDEIGRRISETDNKTPAVNQCDSKQKESTEQTHSPPHKECYI